MTKIFLISGAAGFIASALSEKLLNEGHIVYGVDNLNDYYTPVLKNARLERVRNSKNGANFHFTQLDIADMGALEKVFKEAQPNVAINIAAQASVRYDNYKVYTDSNLVGFMNMIQCARMQREQHGEQFEHFMYASSSSVYGNNKKVPFEESDPVTEPRSLYAASKRSNELLAYSYANMYGLPCTGLRFFTVYGPWGRPDMAPYMFGESILAGKPIKVFNKGDLWRDFTYIDDIVDGVVNLIPHPPQTAIPADVFNVGNGNSVQLMAFIEAMEKAFGKKAILDMQPCPPTEVYKTYANTSKLKELTGYAPNTPLEQGLEAFAEWFIPWHEQHLNNVVSIKKAS